MVAAGRHGAGQEEQTGVEDGEQADGAGKVGPENELLLPETVQTLGVEPGEVGVEVGTHSGKSLGQSLRERRAPHRRS